MRILPFRQSFQEPPARTTRPKVANRAGSRREPPVLLAFPDADPIEVRVAYGPGRTLTAIYRRWAEGTVGPGGLCRRCPTCAARGDACLMMVPSFVSRAEAGDYSPDRAGHRLTPM